MDMDHTGNHFEDTKILIDTGALISTGVAISEYFFTNHLQGKISDLVPSDLNSANGASSNSTMETVGQLEVRIRFNQMSTIFSGSAVVLKNLSLPVIIGVNFLKTNSIHCNFCPVPVEYSLRFHYPVPTKSKAGPT